MRRLLYAEYIHLGQENVDIKLHLYAASVARFAI